MHTTEIGLLSMLLGRRFDRKSHQHSQDVSRLMLEEWGGVYVSNAYVVTGPRHACATYSKINSSYNVWSCIWMDRGYDWPDLTLYSQASCRALSAHKLTPLGLPPILSPPQKVSLIPKTTLVTGPNMFWDRFLWAYSKSPFPTVIPTSQVLYSKCVPSLSTQPPIEKLTTLE